MAVLVTGGAGFIGSHIVDILIENGYDVVVIDNMYLGKKENLNPKARFYNLDINSSLIEDIFRENQIEYISHHAAQAAVSISTSDPLFDAKSNIIGTVNLLEMSKRYKVKKFIYASTAAVYGTPQYLPVDEKHTTKPMSNYGLSKLTAERYIQLSGQDYIIFRYANIYGPRQNTLGEAGVISIFIDKIENNQTLEIHGNGEQTRDFLYVKDVAKANLKVIQNQIKNEKLNISTNSRISINEVCDIIKNKNTLVKYTSSRKGDIQDSILDNSKIVELLGWNPEYELTKGLEELKNSKEGAKKVHF